MFKGSKEHVRSDVCVFVCLSVCLCVSVCCVFGWGVGAGWCVDDVHWLPVGFVGFGECTLVFSFFPYSRRRDRATESCCISIDLPASLFGSPLYV